MLSIDDITDLLGIPLLGCIPESLSVLNSSNAGSPVILDPKSDAGDAYAQLVGAYLKEAPPVIAKKSGFLHKWFGTKKHEEHAS